MTPVPAAAVKNTKFAMECKRLKLRQVFRLLKRYERKMMFITNDDPIFLIEQATRNEINRS